LRYYSKDRLASIAKFGPPVALDKALKKQQKF